MKLILASASPRRVEILHDAGFDFEVHPAHVNEMRHPRESAVAYVSRLASSKARLIAQKLQAKKQHAYVIGADTIVVAGRNILGKPANVADARRMLRQLSGKKHKVLTGVSVICVPSRKESIHVETTQVQFVRITSKEIQEYLATREPFDKAGAYGIQGIGGRFVRRIEGCYFNVMGLPLSRVWSMLRAAGWSDRKPRRKFRS